MNQFKSTEKRVKKLRSLIDEFLQAPDGKLDKTDVSIFLGFTKSGTRKYIEELKIAELITTLPAIGADKKCVIYHLTANEERLNAYLDAIPLRATMKSISAEPTTRKKAELIVLSPGRHLHLMSHDQLYAVHSTTTIAHRDPLVAALFGNKKFGSKKSAASH